MYVGSSPVELTSASVKFLPVVGTFGGSAVQINYILPLFFEYDKTSTRLRMGDASVSVLGSLLICLHVFRSALLGMYTLREMLRQTCDV